MKQKKDLRAKVFQEDTEEFKAFHKFEGSNFFENNLYYDLSTHSTLKPEILYNIVKQIFGEGYETGKQSKQ